MIISKEFYLFLSWFFTPILIDIRPFGVYNNKPAPVLGLTMLQFTNNDVPESFALFHLAMDRSHVSFGICFLPYLFLDIHKNKEQ